MIQKQNIGEDKEIPKENKKEPTKSEKNMLNLKNLTPEEKADELAKQLIEEEELEKKKKSSNKQKK